MAAALGRLQANELARVGDRFSAEEVREALTEICARIETVGLELVRLLTTQMNATLRFEQTDPGLRASLETPGER